MRQILLAITIKFINMFESIFNFLGSEGLKAALENVTRILSILGIVFGSYLACLYFIRDLKFSALKALLDEDREGRRILARKLIEYKSELLGSALGVDVAEIITDEFFNENIEKWKKLFQESQHLNAELANVVHLMYQSLLIVRNTVKEKERNRIHFKQEFYDYYISVVNILLAACQKMRLFPTVRQALFPFRKTKVFRKEFDRVTTKTDLKTDTVADVGVNISGIRREILSFTSELMRIRNPILPYSIDRCLSLRPYILRLLYFHNLYFVSSFVVEFWRGESIEYHLFRFELNREFLGGKTYLKLFYLPNNRMLKISSTQFFKQLERDKKNKWFVVKDTYTDRKFKIGFDEITFTSIYDNNMIVINLEQSRCTLKWWEKPALRRKMKKEA